MYNFLFRATVTDIDVWRKLSTNWDHFFWLTGETPDTLDVIIDRLHHRMNIHRRCGRISFMSTRNQVRLKATSTEIWLLICYLPSNKT